MILVDTSVWVDHLRRGLPQLAELLDAGMVLMHPFVQGELACGHLENRAELLRLFGDMAQARHVTDAEALQFIERHALMGVGIGYVDVHLLASTALEEGVRLWTGDKRLAAQAEALGIGIGKKVAG